MAETKPAQVFISPVELSSSLLKDGPPPRAIGRFPDVDRQERISPLHDWKLVVNSHLVSFTLLVEFKGEEAIRWILA